MTLPDFDQIRPRPTDGLDPLSGKPLGMATYTETSMPHGDHPKREPVAEKPKAKEGFEPQPPAGNLLSSE